MRYLWGISIALAALGCAPRLSRTAELQRITDHEKAGNFTEAARLAGRYIAHHDPPADTLCELMWRKERMRRTALDFNRKRGSVAEYVRRYFPEADEKMLARWEAAGSLEYMVIDGRKRYFNRGARNLLLLDKEAAARRRQVDGATVDAKENILKTHLPETVDWLRRTGDTRAPSLPMRVKYSITLDANAVPEGETVRCWLPYPREDVGRQSGVELLAPRGEGYIVSPSGYAHRTLYMEKRAVKDEPLRFAMEFSYRSAAEWFDLTGRPGEPDDSPGELYATYTAQRPPHIVFTDSIKAISRRIVGEESDPVMKMKKIFEWVDETFPWAGAREYSTIDNLADYVVRQRHGDCGQVTMLTITLARYNGIPARWQSGFMMHPGAVNLHDWSEYYVPGVGWIPMDQSFGINRFSDEGPIRNFYTSGIDAYRWIVNNDYSRELFPAKIYLRSETVDFQRGELEWRGGNIYFDKWKWDIEVFYE